MSNKNDLQNTISDELKEIDNPFKLVMSLGKISRLLEREFEKLGEFFKSIDGNKGDYYGVFHDYSENDDNFNKFKEEIKSKNGVINNDKNYKINSYILENLFKGNIQQGFLFSANIEEYKKTDFLNKKVKIFEFYKDKKQFGENIVYHDGKIINSDFKISDFNQSFIEKKFNAFEKNIKNNYNLLGKILIYLSNHFLKYEKYFIKRKIKNSEIYKYYLDIKNTPEKKIDIYKKYKNNILDKEFKEKNDKLIKNEQFKLNNFVLLEEFKFKQKENNLFFTKLKNIILSLSDNFGYPIFAPFFLGKLAKNLKVDSDTLKIIDVLVSNGLSENYDEYLLTKKFFIQLIDRKEKSFKVILQYLSIIILIILSLIFLPIALNGLFIILFILLKIKDNFLIKKFFIRWNFGFGIISILLLTISFITLISTYKFDNLIILSDRFHNSFLKENLNKSFLQNPVNLIFGNDSEEIKKCYNFDYLKEGKSCFEKKNEKK